MMRHPLLSNLMRIGCHLAYWSGFGGFAGWLWRKATSETWTILAYHRVGEPTGNGGPDLVSVANFRAHLAFARKRYEIVTVGEALRRIAKDPTRRRPLLSITFDDGYRDTVATALPILLQERCCATLYVTCEAIKEGLPPWPHRLSADLQFLASNRDDHWIQQHSALHPMLGRMLWEVGEGKDPGAVVRRIVEEAKRMPDQERAKLCAAAAVLSGAKGDTVAPMMNEYELHTWGSAGMEIGSHTISHPILARLRGPGLREELSGSKRWLETKVDKTIELLAYPNGGWEDWDEMTVAEALAAGYRSAVTTVQGRNGSQTDRFTLRRISIGNDPLSLFSMRIAGLEEVPRRLLTILRRLLGLAPEARLPRHLVDPAAKQRPIRVAFIGGRGVGAAYSGIERYYEEVGSRLAARGHPVYAYCRSYFAPVSKVYRGIGIRRHPTVRQKHLDTLIHTLLATLDVCFRRVDVVQFHALGSSPFAWIPRIFGKKTIVSVRGLDWQRAKWGWLARAYLRFCEWTALHCPNATVVVSQELQKYLQAKSSRLVHYIPNGVNPPNHPSPDRIREWGLRGRDYFLYAGRLSPEKDLEVLIRAHRMLGSACKLVIAGGSSYSGRYVDQLRSMAGDAVIFTGFVNGVALEELFANALAFVLPSRIEGLSVALLEAMSYGLPVIASDIPENRELVESCDGFLFKLGDSSGLTAAMQRVLSDQAGSLRVGERASSRVRERFGWDLIAQETEDLYRTVLLRKTLGERPVVLDAEAA